MIIAATVLTAFVVKLFILDATYIPSRSMMDVLLPGDYVLINKFLFGARTPPALSGKSGPLPSLSFPAVRDPRRGDILVFWFPSATGGGGLGSGGQFVKRCIAVPGDSLLIEAGVVWVNGRQMALLEGDASTRIGCRIPRPGDSVTVNDRTPGIVRELALRGRDLSGVENGATAVPATYAVASEFYFVLGDRTSLSLDSRHWGLIPREWIVGTPLGIYWSAEPESAGGGLSSRLHGIRWSRLGRLVR